MLLLYGNLCARCCFASKLGFFHLGKFYDAVYSSVNSEVAAHVCARASYFGAASLAYKYFASANFLATKALYAETLTSIVVDVFA